MRDAPQRPPPDTSRLSPSVVALIDQRRAINAEQRAVSALSGEPPPEWADHAYEDRLLESFLAIEDRLPRDGSNDA
jgi:hypothetical protein